MHLVLLQEIPFYGPPRGYKPDENGAPQISKFYEWKIIDSPRVSPFNHVVLPSLYNASTHCRKLNQCIEQSLYILSPFSLPLSLSPPSPLSSGPPSLLPPSLPDSLPLSSQYQDKITGDSVTVKCIYYLEKGDMNGVYYVLGYSVPGMHATVQLYQKEKPTFFQVGIL